MSTFAKKVKEATRPPSFSDKARYIHLDDIYSEKEIL